MELIIKPTEACNFKCTFCSSTDIAYDKKKTLDLQYIYDFLKRFPNTHTIIVNGGDPLMMPPEYYWEIIKHLDEIGSECTLSLTTNLWAFYKKPGMWEELFRHPRVGVTTSFNYGETRRVTKSQNYSEGMFWDVSDLFLERVGYRPDFISVITKENEDTAIDNVLLARDMGVECKLNYAMASGDQSEPYMLSKMYKVYVEIYRRGLWMWEYNTKQMMRRLKGRSNSCPQCRNCDEGIRALNPEGDYYSCGAIADDRVFPINFTKEVVQNGPIVRRLSIEPELQSLKMDCFSCRMFDICNGCRKTIKDLKQHGMVEDHCSIMKTLESEIVLINDECESMNIDLNKKTTFTPPAKKKPTFIRIVSD